MQEVKAHKIGVRYSRIVVTIFIFLGVIALAIFIVYSVHKVDKLRIHLLYFKDYLKRSIFWNFFIRLYLQGYLKLMFNIGMVFYTMAAKPDKKPSL